jgi:hypothetical protein
MSLRFTETNKWKDDWFLSLSNDYRIVWLYIIDNCSIAGLWEKGFRHLNYFCNTELDEKKFKEIFGAKIIDLGKHYFIPNFLRIQYPSGLLSNKPMIVAVRRELQKYNLNNMIDQSLFNDKPIIKVNGNGNGKRKKVKEKILFKSSVFFDFKQFDIALQQDEKYKCFDTAYYYEVIKNWSAQGHMKKDWIATVKNWMLRDLKEGNPKLKQEYEQELKQQKNGLTLQQRIEKKYKEFAQS